MAIRLIAGGKFPARKLDDVIPNIGSELSSGRIGWPYIRLLYVQTDPSRRRAQLAADVLWNTEAGRQWRVKTAQKLYKEAFIKLGSTPMKHLAMYWPQFSEGYLKAQAIEILGKNSRGQNIFDLAWTRFENNLRTILWNEGETYDQATRRIEGGVRATAQAACAGVAFPQVPACIEENTTRIRREGFDMALRRYEIALERGNLQTWQLQKLNLNLNLAQTEIERLLQNQILGGADGDITRDDALVPADTDSELLADDAAVGEEQRKKTVRNVAIGSAALLGTGIASYLLFFRR